MSEPLLEDAIKQALGIIRPKSNDKTHYEALGRFIAAFANVEGVVHVLARKISGLSDEKARILFGGMRLSDVLVRLRQLMPIDQATQDSYSELDICLTQLAGISDRRHKLVHRGATYFAGGLISGNAQTAKSVKHMEVETIDENALTAMTLDCGSIYLRLSYLANPSATDQHLVLILKSRPWRYIPPKANTQNQPPQKAPAKQKRQPSALQE
jgi:hypothetical protein